MQIAIPLMVFFISIFLGLEIAFVFVLTGLTYIIYTGQWNLMFSITQVFNNTFTTWELMAVPLFILTGELMGRCGLVEELFAFVNNLVGRWRGGVAYATQIATYFLAGIAGSANAEAASVTRLLFPVLRKEGFSGGTSAAILSAASLKGAIVPPSMLYIMYGAITNTSIEQMFLGGFTVGFMVMLGHWTVVFLKVRRDPNIKCMEAGGFKDLVKTFWRAVPVLAIPFVIFFGMLTGWFTATETGAAAAFISLVAGVLFYKRISLKSFGQALLITAKNTGAVMLIIAASSILGYFFTYENIPRHVGDFMQTYIHSPLAFLMTVNLILLVLGFIIEPIPVILMMMPILGPLSHQYGLDPVQFGLIVCLNSLMGLLTPLVGGVLFVVAAISKVRFEDLGREAVPFLVVSWVVLLLITVLPPSFVLWPLKLKALF